MSKLWFWVSIISTIILCSWLVFGNLIPFLIAFICAYILQPLINIIRIKYHIPRTVVVYLVLAIFLSGLIIGMVILLPIVYQQVFILINKIPIYKTYVQEKVVPIAIAKISSVDPLIADKIRNLIESFTSSLFAFIAAIFNNIWSYTMATINIFFIFCLVPIILIYFLRDWPKIISNLESLLPLKHKNTIKNIIQSINNLLSAYVRGQLNVCLILSVYYSIGLYLIGLEPALLLGVLSGFLIIIPFIGTLLSFSAVLIIGYLTFGINTNFFCLIVLYLCGLLLENYILTPKIIGDKIGLHPLWIIFAVLALGNLFGFIGIFFAIPLAGIIKILMQHLIALYKASRFYKS